MLKIICEHFGGVIILTSLAKEKKTVTAAQAKGMQKLAINFKKYWQIYLLLIPALVWYILFAYYDAARWLRGE